MASKIKEQKETRGFTKDAPCCKNCEHFTYDVVESTAYTGVVYKENKNLRCKFSEPFKVGYSTYCNYWCRKPAE